MNPGQKQFTKMHASWQHRPGLAFAFGQIILFTLSVFSSLLLGFFISEYIHIDLSNEKSFNRGLSADYSLAVAVARFSACLRLFSFFPPFLGRFLANPCSSNCQNLVSLVLGKRGKMLICLLALGKVLC